MMKKNNWILVFSAVCLSVSAREWTGADGRKTQADIVSVYPATRTARLKGGVSGKIYTVPFSQFSEADRHYLEHYAKGHYLPPIVLDCSAVPDLQKWGERGVELMREWYPMISELLYSDNFVPPEVIKLKINDDEKGLAGASGSNIGVASGWIKRSPDDVGVLIHELVHVVQGYGRGGVFWINEGMADYIRWGLYEKKPLEWFHLPKDTEKAYLGGYQVAGGFIYWLETKRAPAIMKPLSAAMRNCSYSDELFKQVTGSTLDELWVEYCVVRGR